MTETTEKQIRSKWNDPDPSICPACGGKMTEIVRMTNTGKPSNTDYICENPKCPLYVNYKRVRDWKYARLVERPEPEKAVSNPSESRLAERYQRQIEKNKGRFGF